MTWVDFLRFRKTYFSLWGKKCYSNHLTDLDQTFQDFNLTHEKNEFLPQIVIFNYTISLQKFSSFANTYFDSQTLPISCQLQLSNPFIWKNIVMMFLFQNNILHTVTLVPNWIKQFKKEQEVIQWSTFISIQSERLFR